MSKLLCMLAAEPAALFAAHAVPAVQELCQRSVEQCILDGKVLYWPDGSPDQVRRVRGPSNAQQAAQTGLVTRACNPALPLGLLLTCCNAALLPPTATHCSFPLLPTHRCHRWPLCAC